MFDRAAKARPGAGRDNAPLQNLAERLGCR